MKKKITQDELAKMLDSTRQTISNYLAGRSKLDVFTLEKIADCLGVSVSYFFNDEASNVTIDTKAVNINRPKYLEQRVDVLEKEIKALQIENKKLAEKLLEACKLISELNFNKKNEKSSINCIGVSWIKRF